MTAPPKEAINQEIKNIIYNRFMDFIWRKERKREKGFKVGCLVGIPFALVIPLFFISSVASANFGDPILTFIVMILIYAVAGIACGIFGLIGVGVYQLIRWYRKITKEAKHNIRIRDDATN